MFSTTQRIGILGGGQLGKMLCLAAAPWNLRTFVLDPNPDCPAATLCSGFTVGHFNDYDAVLAFGQDKDLLTIEIEHVNTEALLELERQGKVIQPAPATLQLIQDKGLQKAFYREHDLPTARFELFEDENALLAAIEAGRWTLPLVQKTRTAGYDGRGVAILRSPADLSTKLLRGPCLAEELAPIQCELAVIAARSPGGEVEVFPPVEMDFHPEANLVELLLCPARVSPLVAAEAEALAERVIRAFDLCGLLAVEMFLTHDGDLLINEVAPRPHNSGHHTIDTAATSQYQQLLRCLLDLPLGDTTQRTPAAMLNLLGEAGYSGPAHYTGVEECLGMGGVYLHLYGKTYTAPFRKMGHVTTAGATIEEAIRKAHGVKQRLKVVTVSGS